MCLAGKWLTSTTAPESTLCHPPLVNYYAMQWFMLACCCCRCWVVFWCSHQWELQYLPYVYAVQSGGRFPAALLCDSTCTRCFTGEGFFLSITYVMHTATRWAVCADSSALVNYLSCWFTVLHWRPEDDDDRYIGVRNHGSVNFYDTDQSWISQLLKYRPIM